MGLMFCPRVKFLMRFMLIVSVVLLLLTYVIFLFIKYLLGKIILGERVQFIDDIILVFTLRGLN